MSNTAQELGNIAGGIAGILGNILIAETSSGSMATTQSPGFLPGETRHVQAAAAPPVTEFFSAGDLKNIAKLAITHHAAFLEIITDAENLAKKVQALVKTIGG